MDNFNFTQFLAEGKLYENTEALSQEEVMDMAGMVADAFTEEAGGSMIYKVGNVEGMHFELDTEATENTPEEDAKYGTGEGWGGSFHIKALDNGYEIRNSEKGGLVATMDMEDGFKMLSADESRAEMGLEEGIIDNIKDKIVAKVDKIKSKFSDEEIAKMKAVAEKAIGKSAEEVTMADFTIDNIKKVGKAISALNEEEQIEEGLGEKIQGLGAGLGLPAMFVGGHMAMASQAGGMEGFIAGAIAFVVGLIGGAIIKSMDEVKEEPKKSKMKKSELKEMIRQSMLAEAEKDEEKDEDVAVEDTEDTDVDMDVDMDMGDDAGIEMDGEASDSEVSSVQQDLQDALKTAQAMGDEKLVNQIKNTLIFFTRTHVIDAGEDDGLMEVESELEEALNKPVTKLGPDVEKRLQSMGFETKVFPNPAWGNIPNEAIDAIEANPKLAGIAFVKNQSGSEAMRVMVNAERKKDLQKLRDYFQVPEEKFGPTKELSWVAKQIQNVNPGDWIATKAEVLGGSGNPVAVIDWFRLTTKGASQTRDASGNVVKMDFGQAAESLNESITFPMWDKIK